VPKRQPRKRDEHEGKHEEALWKRLTRREAG
jgi:hypothetical protein